MKAKISKEEIDHLADLSRLDLSSEEKAKMAKDIDGILDLVSELQELDLRDQKPFLFEDQVNITREDLSRQAEPQRGLTDQPATCEPEEYLRAAPDRERQFFKVPRIL